MQHPTYDNSSMSENLILDYFDINLDTLGYRITKHLHQLTIYYEQYPYQTSDVLHEAVDLVNKILYRF